MRIVSLKLFQTLAVFWAKIFEVLLILQKVSKSLMRYLAIEQILAKFAGVLVINFDFREFFFCFWLKLLGQNLSIFNKTKLTVYTYHWQIELQCSITCKICSHTVIFFTFHFVFRRAELNRSGFPKVGQDRYLGGHEQ